MKRQRQTPEVTDAGGFSVGSTQVGATFCGRRLPVKLLQRIES